MKHLLLFNPLLLLILVTLSSCSRTEDDVEDTMPLVDEYVNPYGISVDSLLESKGVIQKNETLSDILLPYGVSFNLISEIAANSRDSFDVRKIRPDKNYTVYLSDDSLYALRYFIYEPDKINYIVFDIKDSIVTYTGQKKVTVSEDRVSGVINSSLFQTLQEKNVSIKLAMKLSEAYAWQIDFYRIQKGDNFKVIFEKQFVDGEFIGIGNIIAAQFTHRKIPFYAFYFEQDGRGEYFDEQGKSLRKTFLQAPLKFSRISSSYSGKRFHPVLKRYKAHLGTDYAAPTGTKIHTVGDGVVTEAQYKKNNGNYVKIKHNSVYTTQYLHMSKIAKGMKPGKYVKQGDVIGYVGSTGLATGPHVCFRFWKNGRQVDHRREEFPSSHPVAEDRFEEYQKSMLHMKSMVDLMTIDIDQSEIAPGI